MKIKNKLIQGFINRAGSHVFLATIFARVASFLSQLIALRLLSKGSLGELIYSYSFIVFLLPFSGLGLEQSLVRFGSLLKKREEKNALFVFVLKKGILITLILLVIIYYSSGFIPFKFNNARIYYLFFSGVLITHFLRNIVQIQLRLYRQNKNYAYSEITYAIVSLLLISYLTYEFKEYGYVMAIIISPLIIFILFITKLKVDFNKNVPLKIINYSFWKYGFFASLAYVTTLLLFEIDNILIGNLLNNAEQVTIYKYISLIPFSLLFLPRVLNTTNYVYVTENIYNKKIINEYIINYVKLFSIVTVIILSFGILFGKNILSLFGKNYTLYVDTFNILLIGITGILLFRGLFGNLLSSLGKAHFNFYIAVFAIVLNLVSNYYFIPKYGIKGAAITSSIIMWSTGLSTFIFFKYFQKKEIN